MTVIALSTEQQAILNAFETTADNLAINSVAGSGKTFMIEQIANRAFEIGIKGVNGRNRSPRILAMSFTNEAVNQLANKIGRDGVEASTMHKIGKKMLLANRQPWMTEYKFWNIIGRLKGEKKPKKGEKPDNTNLTLKIEVARITELARLTQTPFTHNDIEGLLIAHNRDARFEFVDLAVQALEEAENDRDNSKWGYDFADMLWLPFRDKLPVPMEYTMMDYLFVDEVQDWNPLQLDIARKLYNNEGNAVAQTMGLKPRVLIVGDPRQSIMGFAGASNDSFQKASEAFDVKLFSMNITRRCPKKIVDIAKKFVPEFAAADDAPEGIVEHMSLDDFVNKTLDKDCLIICRNIAPLMKVALQLIEKGIVAHVKGKDIGNAIGRILKDIEGDYSLVGEKILAAMESKREYMESEKKNPIEIQGMVDRHLAAITLWKDSVANSTRELKNVLDSMFVDKSQGVMLMSIHSSKGLQAETIYLLGSEKLPMRVKGQLEWQDTQEDNVAYVGYTRVLNRLVMIPMPELDVENDVRNSAKIKIESTLVQKQKELFAWDKEEDYL